ncbi:hypothetical protein GOBAR_AA21467 [Gossypium barbadense]|uniref:Uncharacterized protein n=1 Tax=Gossypium barbadense TaxID=3634 RepID=A0A2P5X792_GOSBA|nr:hypothetical protein GOBAR_AA21467 [Gossypium barbadense]
MHSINFTRIRDICRMLGCLAVNSESQRGGLVLMWKESVDVAIQNYSNHHIDSFVKMEGHNRFRFTGFYGHADPNLRNHSWDILRMMGSSVRKDWIVTIDEFREVMEELALVDIKTDKGQFTWVNNREGFNMIKERLDRFLISANAIDNLHFLATNVVRQANSYRDAILLDTMGLKPREDIKDSRLFFKFDAYWGKRKKPRILLSKLRAVIRLTSSRNLRG